MVFVMEPRKKKKKAQRQHTHIHAYTHTYQQRGKTPKTKGAEKVHLQKSRQIILEIGVSQLQHGVHFDLVVL